MKIIYFTCRDFLMIAVDLPSSAPISRANLAVAYAM
jgi:hypothetical protein